MLEDFEIAEAKRAKEEQEETAPGGGGGILFANTNEGGAIAAATNTNAVTRPTLPSLATITGPQRLKEIHQSPAAPAKKTRVSKACDSCSRARRKCSGGSPENPCGACMEKGKQCLFSRDSKKRGPAVGYLSKMKLQLQQLQDLAVGTEQTEGGRSDGGGHHGGGGGELGAGNTNASSSSSSGSNLASSSSMSIKEKYPHHPESLDKHYRDHPQRQAAPAHHASPGPYYGYQESRRGSLHGHPSAAPYPYVPGPPPPHHYPHDPRSMYAAPPLPPPAPSSHHYPHSHHGYPIPPPPPHEYVPPPHPSIYHQQQEHQRRQSQHHLYPTVANSYPPHSLHTYTQPPHREYSGPPPPLPPPVYDVSRLETWSQVNFESIRFRETDGTESTLVEWFFRYVHVKTPIFSMEWMVKNVTHMPLSLLHAMYAACLLFPSEAPRHEEAKIHADYSEKIVLSDLEQSNGWDVASLMLMSFVSLDTKAKKKAGYLACTCITLALTLKFNKDIPSSFPSAIDGRESFDEETAKNISRAIWFVLFMWDFNSNILISVEFIIKESIPEVMISSFQPPNSGHPSNIQDNILCYYSYIIPIINTGKRILALSEEFLDPPESITLKLLAELDEIFENLPPNFRFSNSNNQWLGRSLNWINEIHIFLRLKLLKNRFLSALRNPQNNSPELVLQDQYVQLSLQAANTITQMASVYLKHRDGLKDKNYVIESLIFRGGLILCAISHVSGIIPIFEVNISLEAMQLVSGLDCPALKECLETPSKAIEILVAQG